MRIPRCPIGMGEDEFVIVLSGEMALIVENSAVILRSGDCAGLKASVSYVHCFDNSSNEPVVLFKKHV